MFLVPRTFLASLAHGHVVDEGEAEGDTRQGVDTVFDGLQQVVVVVPGAVGKCELATAAFGYRFCFDFPAFFGGRSDRLTREKGEWERVGGTFLEWIVALFVCLLFVWRRKREACFSEEGECEDG